MAAITNTENIVFDVVATDDLFLVGSCKTIKRVSQDNRYPVQMLKTQSFGSLFRHYAKYHGLCKDDLIFSFVNELGPEDTPESVHIMRADEVYVKSRSNSSDQTISHCHCMLGTSMRQLMNSEEHSDVKLVIGSGGEELSAHRAILAARSEFFAATFRTRNGSEMQEAVSGIVRLYDQRLDIMLLGREFLYTRKVESCSDLDGDTLLTMIRAAD